MDSEQPDAVPTVQPEAPPQPVAEPEPRPEPAPVATMLTVGVPTETVSGEERVALTPDVLKRMARDFRILVQSGAGQAAGFLDAAYEAAGGTIVSDAESVFNQSDIVLKVQRPTEQELPLLREGQILIALLGALAQPQIVVSLADRKVIALSMDTIPRITRAQSMDALSSMATVAGYKAVLLAANELPKFFPLLMTAAGTIRPAKVLVLGAGVAGLQAIATARRLGAVVEAFDVRPVVKEQVESLGASFVEFNVAAEGEGGYARELTAEDIQHEIALIKEHAAKSDVVITTAQIPGRPAPMMMPEDTVQAMQPGSVIVDLAAETGGNCQLSVAGETIQRYGVTIMGPVNLPATMAFHASEMYAKNVSTLLEHLAPKGQFTLNLDDDITKGVCLTRDGEILYGPTKNWLKEKEGVA
ncbi:MAG TPA: Re/Si-specific NAD(P)(+) transhydrogenase subunit alpha [Thermomicrobiaceae bacterium]|nr:Re/Si-specific NAD(P)(+) transhydrogenase subunit alpha [Thermomicrobiaceae bacterium]